MKQVFNGVDSLPLVGTDSTLTKGKVSGKFTIEDDTEATVQIEKLDKNQVFAQVIDYFSPIKFDDSVLRSSLEPLVKAGIMSEDVFLSTLQKSKKEFLDAHSEEIEKAQNISFSTFIARLQENESLYNKVLSVCNISSIDESNYIRDNKVCIYRANQCTDKEGQNRYFDVTLSRTTSTGEKFFQSLFVERRLEFNVTNYICAVRYYASKQEAERKLANQVIAYFNILKAVSESAKKAKDANFSKEAILAEIEKVFAE